MNSSFSDQVRNIISFSREEAIRLGNDFIGSEHLLLGLIREGENQALTLLKMFKVEVNELRDEIELSVKNTKGHFNNAINDLTPFNKQAEKIIKLATLEARYFRKKFIDSEHLLLSILRNKESVVTQILADKFEVDYDLFKNQMISMIANQGSDLSSDDKSEDDEKSKQSSSKPTVDFGTSNKSKTPVLDNFSRDITRMAEGGKLDPIVGRDKEIDRVSQILSRRKKNNPILIGEAGVGKTAIVEGLALRIVQRKVSRVLFDKKVVSLDLAALVAGTKYRGQFEERVKSIMNELEKNRDIILFIDEVHTIIGAGGASGSLDAGNIFKPALSRGEIQCIGASTLDEYRMYIEKDGALDRRFQKVLVNPPSVDEAIQILRNIKPKYEDFHNVSYTDEAIKACVYLSDRYVSDKLLPDKAIDVFDEVGAKVHLKNIVVPPNILDLEKEIEDIKLEKNKVVKSQLFEEAARLRDKEKVILERLQLAMEEWENESKNLRYTITEEDVADVISMMTDIPVKKMVQAENEKLRHLAETIGKEVIGQQEAVQKVCKAIQRNRIGLKDPKKPIGSFIFLGPTGVGKTELAKSLSNYLLENKESLVRIDMSEYMEKYSLSRLIGAPPGYVGYEEGGQLTEKIRRKPYSVILLDEIEKAHPDIFNILLQVLDEGILTDGLGRKVDFKNTIIIMTSNIGARQIKDFGVGIGFGTQNMVDNKEAIHKSIIEKSLKKTFSPEFMNRVDDIVIFNSLEKESIYQIIEIITKDVLERISDNIAIDLQISDAAKSFLTDKGFDKEYGARPLKRAIQRYLEDGLADEILSENIVAGNAILADVNDDKTGLKFSQITSTSKTKSASTKTKKSKSQK